LTCTEAEDLLPEYALGILDPQAHQNVSAVLSSCDGLPNQLAEWTALTEGLLFAVPPRAPSASVKKSLMARIQPVRVPSNSSVFARLRRWLAGAWPVPRRVMGSALAAVMTTAVFLGAASWQLMNDRAVLTQQLAEHQRALAILAQPQAQVIRLEPQAAAPNATATLQFDPAQNLAVLSTDGLSELDPAQAYQLWLFGADGAPIPSRVFTGASRNLVLVTAAQPLGHYNRFAISIEPAQGSPQPTGPIALISRLQQN
jgi:anti-sigma-K factor RskA